MSSTPNAQTIIEGYLAQDPTHYDSLMEQDVTDVVQLVIQALAARIKALEQKTLSINTNILGK